MRRVPGQLFGYGFRPFFLGAGLLAALLVPWWAIWFAWGAPLPAGWPPTLWHGHEMLFGFIAAAIAGFLLTAVPSWTAARGFAGWPLAALAGLWAAGRVVIATAGLWPRVLAEAIDLAFLPALAVLVAPPLVRSRNRNTRLLAVLAALWGLDLLFYRGLAGGNVALARHALLIGIDVVLLLVTVIGGRIIPAFTSAALRQRGISSPLRVSPVLTGLAVGGMLAVIAADALAPESRLAGIVALAAAIIQAVRLAQWGTWRTLRMPIVWVLHLAYLWLPLGLALKALALLRALPPGASYLHALTIGAVTTMILAVMTRASLGHTGRPIVAARPTVWAYGLLTAAAAVRALGPVYIALPYAQVILLAATLWTAAFVLFLGVYGPILLAPRADGRPG
jgi:uncharacterized protein involved in response to NO